MILCVCVCLCVRQAYCVVRLELGSLTCQSMQWIRPHTSGLTLTNLSVDFDQALSVSVLLRSLASLFCFIVFLIYVCFCKVRLLQPRDQPAHGLRVIQIFLVQVQCVKIFEASRHTDTSRCAIFEICSSGHISGTYYS